MATYRYWRATFYRAPGGFATIMNEMQLLDASSANLAHGGTAVASQENQAAALAFDGSDSTAWAAIGGYTHWLQYDLGSEQDVRSVNLRMLGNNNQAQLATILASHDGFNWDVVSASIEMPLITTTYGDFLLPVVATPIVGEGGTLGLFGDTAVPTPRFTTFTDRSSGDLGVSGRGGIAGEVEVSGTPDTPIGRKVRLHASAGGAPVRETWSDPVTGAYAFGDLDPRQSFYLIALDFEHNYNAVIKDNIVPEVTP